jgi:hypothetical protein
MKPNTSRSQNKEIESASHIRHRASNIQYHPIEMTNFTTSMSCIKSSDKMHYYRLVLIALFNCCFIGATYSQTPGERTIPNDELKWEYYTVKSDTNVNYWATTLWRVYYRYSVVSVNLSTVKIQLQTWHVLTPDSWVLKDKESDELLHHEQGHFNTAILCEAEFKKAIDTTTLFMNNYSQKIDSVFNAVMKSITELNVEYDKETNHMWNRDAQKQWDSKISDWIKEANSR